MANGKQFSSEYQPAEKWTEKRALAIGGDLIDWMKSGGKNQIYMQEFLILENDLHPDLPSYLSKKFPSFSELLKRAKKIQEIKLIKYGTADKLNASFTKFVLINNHDYKMKVETTNPDGETKTTTIEWGGGEITI